MSTGSEASAGNLSQKNESDSPGNEGASCGACRQVDNSRMVQCDECDEWYHYDCVNVNDSIQDKDWSCNGCVRTSLEKERASLRIQLKRLEEQQKQWQQEQQKRLEQDEERQRKLEQQQGGEQFDPLQIAKLQLQQQSMQARGATSKPSELQNLQSSGLGATPKLRQQSVEVGAKCTVPVPSIEDRRDSVPLASSTADGVNIGKGDRASVASSKQSKRSAKLREQQIKALEARQALEKKQLEERLALEKEMLEMSDSDLETIGSVEKMDDWLERTDQMGRELQEPLDETPLPVYDKVTQEPVMVSNHQKVSSRQYPEVPCQPQRPFQDQHSFPPAVTQPVQRSCVPSDVYLEHDLYGSGLPVPVSRYQPSFGNSAGVTFNLPPLPLYTTVSQPTVIAPAHPQGNLRYPTTSSSSPFSHGISQPGRITSTPRTNVSTSQRPIGNGSVVTPLNSGHLAARQTVKDLPKFGGDPEDWPRFIAAYERTTRMCAFRNDELLDRLERSLYDKALNSVKSLLLHPDNVPVIMNRLKTLFGNPEFIVETMVNKVKMMPPPKAEKLETIVDFGVAVQNLCATIQVCQMDERFYNVALLQELVDSLPPTLKMKWAFYRKEIGAATLREFNAWLGNMVDAISQVSRPQAYTKPLKMEKKGRKEDAFVHLHSEQPPELINRRACLACAGECSSLDKCNSFLRMVPNARWALVNEKKICRKCLTKHFRTCEIKVPCNQNGCSFLHHRLLHDDSKHQGRSSPSELLENSSCNAHHCPPDGVLLKYVRVTLHGKNRSIDTYAFLDAGSTSTLMEHSLWEELNLGGERNPLCITWTGGQGRYEGNSVKCSLDISGAQNPTKRFYLSKVHTVRKLDLPSQSMSATELTRYFQYLSGLPLESYSKVKPRILIGVDNSRLDYPLDSREGSYSQPTAVLTRLGWIIYGPCSVAKRSTTVKENAYSYHICECDALQSAVKNYFALDSLGIQLNGKTLMSNEDERAINLLQSNTVLKDKKYETCLLWRYDNVRLPESKAMALKRHNCLDKRMEREPELARVFQEKIFDYKAKGYIRELLAHEEEMQRERSWYLPIFPVFNPNKPGKLRIVWDAAAKVGAVSLNTFLLKGPDLVTPLPQVLHRFREHRVAVSGDVREMFHQVLMNRDDQHCLRFFCNEGFPGKAPTVYVMQVMTFGASCSPSSAQYVKNLNAERFRTQFPEAVEAICKGTYVDDMLYSVETEEEAVRLAQNVRFIYSEGGFEIRGWLSNSKKVVESMGEYGIAAKSLDQNAELATEKVLGMWWDTISDTFTFRTPQRCRPELLSGQQVPTKREVLRILMSVYDPLGLLANVLMYLKVLLQEIWRMKIGWDEPISDELFAKWKAWINVLNMVESVAVPRCYRTTTSSSLKTNEVQLHIFVDASEDGYAAVAYFRYEEGGVIECAFVTAKTRVAPLKYVSVPRLELQAAVIGTRLASYIEESHRVSVRKRFFWTDSRDVLCWLRSDHRRYSKFVAPKVGEILEKTELTEWFWVPTKLNVADEGTKWQKTPDLSPLSRWFRGPDFLRQQRSAWPAQPLDHGSTTNEMKLSINVHVARDTLIDFSKFSKWRKLVRTIAWVLRFPRNIRAKHQHSQPTIGILQQMELFEAENFIYRQAQLEEFSEEMSLLHSGASIPKDSSIYKLSPFLDENGVLRMSGRTIGCEFIEPTNAHTILLPRKHPVTTCVVKSVHEQYHHLNHETVVNELRQKYRIPRLRSVCYKIRQDCQACKNARASPQPPLMADLPPARLAGYTRPFAYVGIDYFGPIQVVVGRRTEKRWGVLFTCLVVRAIHIEIVHSLNTSSYILALQNFIARRGTPIEVFSDRGTNFVGAERELRDALRSIDHSKLMEEIVTPDTKWTFLPPSSPHMGGSWERLVKSVKKILYQIKLPRLPTDEVLRNKLLEIEKTINSRPLTYIPVEDGEKEALTPNHFLLGSSSGSKPLVPYNDSLATLTNSWRTSQIYANLFWKRWLQEYLPSISRRTKWHYPVKPIQIGDVVIITDPDLPRNSWPKGRVVDVKRGKDGQVRSATVKTAVNVYERPAVKLAVLDVGATLSKQDPGPCVLGGNVTQYAKRASDVQKLSSGIGTIGNTGKVD
ncbi:uncharacterized protein LOC128736105 [Sabethes cyaneus]|uniref:uncharacterized protein LOC128736105 n=1 Tax=Sabethes cyaneus TaxID=53552 RepID=UPI00237DC0F8|nr:uncharacterized protein LOC128736105 [Sabethes cyaneus]